MEAVNAGDGLTKLLAPELGSIKSANFIIMGEFNAITECNIDILLLHIFLHFYYDA